MSSIVAYVCSVFFLFVFCLFVAVLAFSCLFLSVCPVVFFLFVFVLFFYVSRLLSFCPLAYVSVSPVRSIFFCVRPSIRSSSIVYLAFSVYRRILFLSILNLTHPSIYPFIPILLTIRLRSRLSTLSLCLFVRHLLFPYFSRFVLIFFSF